MVGWVIEAASVLYFDNELRPDKNSSAKCPLETTTVVPWGQPRRRAYRLQQENIQITESLLEIIVRFLQKDLRTGDRNLINKARF